MAKITELSIVMNPKPNSRLEDVLTTVTFNEFRMLILGGLDAKEVQGMYESRLEATRVARKLLEKVNPHALKSRNKLKK